MNPPITSLLQRLRMALLPALLLWVCAFPSHATPTFEPVHGLALAPRGPQAKPCLASDGNFYGTTYSGGAIGGGTAFKMTPTGTLTVLVNFVSTNGYSPSGGLVQGSDGNFYGTTYQGGSNGYGTVFRMTPTGTLTTLVHFAGTNGRNPYAGLVLGSDGDFYGTTYNGGTSNYGTVFKMTPTGTLTTLVHFTETNGSNPYAGLVQGSDGNFYGTTELGGSNYNGTLFKMTPGGTLTTLVNLDYFGTSGARPYADLLQGSDGNFYGTTQQGGSYGLGTVFKMTPGGTLTTLVEFSNNNGGFPYAELLEGTDGNFYGTTRQGGSFYNGTVFKMTPGGTLTTLVNFDDSNNGRAPQAGLVQGGDGNLYGTTIAGGIADLGTVFKMTPGGSLTTLVNFYTVGSKPYDDLVLGSDGNFYGTTYDGGTGRYGTVFKMTPSGMLTTLVNFTGTNGGNPFASLVQGIDGSFYGTTYNGGTGGGGTVFRMTPTGTLTTLVNFTFTNGSEPQAGLIQGNDGNFYGTTSGGGSSNNGTVFKMTPGGDLTTLVNFTGTNGRYPKAKLVQGSDGNFYGTSHAGGSSNLGTVFKMTPAGTLTTLVHFTGTNGRNPRAQLLQGIDGNFHGTTELGGSIGYGTVFTMTPAGVVTTLVNFNNSNGWSPYGGLLRGSDGNFYGTTNSGGGSGSYGIVFKMTPSGTLTTLVNFTGANGRHPLAGLVQGNDGYLYGSASEWGTTSDGQPAGGGQIFRLRMGPAATTQTQSNVTTSSATLVGTVNPGGYETPVSFQYGTDPTLATFTTAGAGTLPVGTSDVGVQASVSGLSPETTYFYRVLASNVENALPQYGSILSFTTLAAPGSYSSWAESRFTPLQLADPLVSGPYADPDQDGISNLLESAFNMLPMNSGNQILTPGTGTVGLPLISTLGSGPSTRLRIEFIRRKSGYTYSPEVSDGLDSGGWNAPTGTPTVTSIDADWERVVIEDTAGTGHPMRFGRVMVTSPGN